jgi:hypothetical protein
MNVDHILRTLNEERVDYLLIGGMNFLLRHLPELTFDVDIWVRDEAENLERLNRVLQKLEAAWGPTEKDWRPVANDWRWLQRQGCFCLTTAHGALDVFRDVRRPSLGRRKISPRTCAAIVSAHGPRNRP